jgi:hypothetical protein
VKNPVYPVNPVRKKIKTNPFLNENQETIIAYYGQFA